MLLDANLPNEGVFDGRVFDVCICGAGVAGITLARKLAEKGHTIALLEGGGLDISEESQDIYAGQNIGLEYFDLDVTRLRYFGGTSNHWDGWCRPLDSHDFDKKPFKDWTGWPISKRNLGPYLAPARTILDLPPKTEPLTEIIPFDRNTLKNIQFDFSPPTNFSKKYMGEIKKSQNIFAFINANITDVVLDEDLRYVYKCQFNNYVKKDPLFLKAKYYILCMGGIENPRFLLNCKKQISRGIGNATDLVGRFFCEHLHYTVGFGVLNERHLSFHRRLFVAPTKEFMAEKQLLNFGLRLLPNKTADLSGIKRSFQERVCTNPFAARLAKAVFGPIGSWWCDFRLGVASEQAPNFDSRITLSEKTDRFGMNRIQLDWRISEIDVRTIFAAVRELGRQLALKDYGRVRVADWLREEKWSLPGLDEDQVGGNHHMCTTRISDNVETGVVDKNLRVFGVENLFLCGSSVFATAGHANPTFTIVQLSLRLADHINKLLSRT